jgi:hypothetical protein
MTTGPSFEYAAEALRLGTRDDPAVAREPALVQAMLIDVLGARARPNRAAIDWLVAAAQHGIVEQLRHDRPELEATVRGLVDRGFPRDVAFAVVQAWARALDVVLYDPPTPHAGTEVDLEVELASEIELDSALVADHVDLPLQLPVAPWRGRWLGRRQ